MPNDLYEAVIGLEVHAELLTKTKIFCSCPISFGAPPNTQCCPVCTGMPGAMPSLNRRVVELGVMAGLALNCEIADHTQADRKQYFYPDLPKAYQISQDALPLCRNGYLDVEGEWGTRRVGITRIHIEEDAGKLIHEGDVTLVDCNRCGVPLIEIVSAPDLRGAKEAAAYLRTLRSILLTCRISDCKMQEGSLRCDVNLSMRRKGSERLGVRVEIKNINSFSFVEKAISYEIERQRALLERGELPIAQTRRYDPSAGKTYAMRSKESAIDYRFLPEPDLLSLHIPSALVSRLRASLPQLPAERAKNLMTKYALREYDAAVLVADPDLAAYFEAAAKECAYPQLLANLLLSDLLRYCTSDPFTSPVPSHRLATVTRLLGEGTVNSATAKKLLHRLTETDLDPERVVVDENLAQLRDSEVIEALVRETVAENERAVVDYRGGKKNAIRALQGKAMAKSAGRADPVLLERALLKVLKKEEDGNV